MCLGISFSLSEMFLFFRVFMLCALVSSSLQHRPKEYQAISDIITFKYLYTHYDITKVLFALEPCAVWPFQKLLILDTWVQ